MSLKAITAYVVCFALFGVTAFAGKEGPGNYIESVTALQRVCSVAVTSYGLFAALALIGLALKKRWALAMVVLWTIAMMVAGMSAPTAWGDEPVPGWSIPVTGIIIAAVGFGIWKLVRWLILAEPRAAAT